MMTTKSKRQRFAALDQFNEQHKMRAMYFNRDIEMRASNRQYTLHFWFGLVRIASQLFASKSLSILDAWENEWHSKKDHQKIYYESNKTSEIKREDINFTNDHQ